MFTPIWGNHPFLLIFFQMGWFNHQQVVGGRWRKWAFNYLKASNEVSLQDWSGCTASCDGQGNLSCVSSMCYLGWLVQGDKNDVNIYSGCFLIGLLVVWLFLLFFVSWDLKWSPSTPKRLPQLRVGLNKALFAEGGGPFTGVGPLRWS